MPSAKSYPPIGASSKSHEDGRQDQRSLFTKPSKSSPHYPSPAAGASSRRCIATHVSRFYITCEVPNDSSIPCGIDRSNPREPPEYRVFNDQPSAISHRRSANKKLKADR